jgi:RNA polymerase sigma-70 factor (ECF subfamily)
LLPRHQDDGEDGHVAAAQRGDRRAFDILLQTHEKLLRGFLMRRVGTDAVEDILQETWVAAWMALPKFTRRSRFKAWLFSIALHKAQDHHRTRGRSPVESLSAEAEASLAGPDIYAAIDLKHAVQTTLSRLPEAQREVLEMYYYAELSLPEIADALGRNPNTVKYQFYRAHTLVADGLGPL